MQVILNSDYIDLLESDKKVIFYNKSKLKLLLKICQPLFERFDITMFEYSHFYNDHACIYISTNLKWYEYFIKNYLRTPLIKTHIQEVSDKNIRYHRWDHGFLSENQMLSQFITERRNFGIWHDFTIYEHHDELKEIESWSFATTKENHELTNRLLNAVDEIAWFIQYFYEQAAEIIAYESFKLLKTEIDLFPALSLPDVICKGNNISLVNKIPIKRFTWRNLPNGPIYLTNRQTQTMYYRCKGMSAKETAQQMGNKERTVETLQSQVKDKSGIGDPIQLRRKFRNSNLSNLPFGRWRQTK